MNKLPFATVILSLAMMIPAAALDGTLSSPSGGTVFVFKNKDATSEAFSLIRAGAHKSNPALLVHLMSCTVPNGTKAITTSVGFMTHDILVIEGDRAGCRGNIPADHFTPSKR